MNNRWLTTDTPLIIGHRGASGEAPENTMKAFRLARDQGAHGIEYDVHLAKDGVPVVIHDVELERTTNGSGSVQDYTSAELAQIDAGEGEGIPTLAQVLAEFGGDFLHNVEVKGGSADAKTLVAAVADVLNDYAHPETIVVSSFEVDLLEASTIFEPPIALAALIDPDAPYFPPDFTGQVVHPYYLAVDEAYMAWAAEHKLAVNVWTIDSPEWAQKLAKLGVAAFITNFPARIQAAL